MTTRSSGAIALIALLLPALVACRGKDGGAKGGPAPTVTTVTTPADAAPVAPDAAREPYEVEPVYPRGDVPHAPVADALCEAIHVVPNRRKAECCGMPPGRSAPMASECARVLSIALADGAVTVDAGGVTQCAAATTAALAGCDWVTPILPAPLEACHVLVHGQRAAGAKCRSSLECVSGLTCRGVGPTDAGVCAAPVAAGEACGGATDLLVSLTGQAQPLAHPSCAGFCLKGRCLAFAPLGGGCSASAQCGAGARCAAAKCTAAPLPAVGQACTDLCAGGATCAAGVCTARKPAGSPCTSPFECQAACVKAPGAAAGTCGMKCD